ncbi:MAG: hotdog fold thioesterase [Bdellovibrionales bacterium]|nr:hotdog fold thioesterase [Bdellovibrionales bacterium]
MNQELAERCVEQMISRDGFSAWLGVTVENVAPGTARVSMKVRSEMLNGFGVCHGGVTYSLADSALAFAANTHGRVAVSIESSMTYPKKVLEGDVLTAEAYEQSTTARIGIYQITVCRADGEKVALMRGIVYRTKEQFFPE